MKLKTTSLFILTLAFLAFVFYSDFDLELLTIYSLAAFVLLIAYLDSGKKFLNSLGFQKKKLSLLNLVVIAPITGLFILLIYRFVLVPLVTELTGVPIDISLFDPIRGNLDVLLSTLVFVWTSAAFGEEVIFRGYLMTRFTKIFGTSNIAIIANIVLIGIFFGSIHAYQGITGQILSGITGAMIATLFHFKKNDLWFCIVVHGSIDTLALTAIYLGIF